MFDDDDDGDDVFVAGCGAHIERVLKDVPVAERCKCPKPPK